MRLKTSFLMEAMKSMREPRNIELNEDISVGKKRFYKKGNVLTYDELKDIHSSGANVLSASLTPRLLYACHSVNPDQYRLPNGVLSAGECLKKLKKLDHANEKSIMRRSLISCTEVLGKKNEVILPYGKLLDEKSIDKLMLHEGEGCKVAYCFSDYRVILYVNLLSHGEGYFQRFIRNTEIINTLTSKFNKLPMLNNLTKLHLEKDFFIIDEPDKLLLAYKKNDVRLIIVGAGIDDEFRKKLILIKKKDPFARFMLASSLDPRHYEKFLLDIELNYSRTIE